MDWSQTRYLDYAYLSIAVHPAPPGATASMQVTALSDLGNEIDRVDLLRLNNTLFHHQEHRDQGR